MLGGHLETKLYSYSKSLNKNVDELRILVCISGGLDSCVLLDIIFKLSCKLKFKLNAAHVNYAYHNRSGVMSNHCYEISKFLNIKLFTLNVKKNEYSNFNFEAKARQIRYNFFDKIDKVEKYDLILTAHHEMDQIETIIMKTIQNTSWISKIGIREFKGKIRRPLLQIGKAAIQDYAKSNKIVFYDDPSNNDYTRLRNCIRLVLKNVTSNKAKSYYLNISKQSLYRFNTSMQTLDKSKVSLNKSYIKINKIFFISLEDEFKKIVIQDAIMNKFDEFIIKSKFFWNKLFELVEKSQSGKKIFLSKNIYLSLDRFNFIIASKELNPSNKIVLNENKKWNDYHFEIESKPNCLYSYENKINYLVVATKLFKKGIYVRSRKPGDKIKVSDFMTKKVKNIFINNKISNIEKDNFPIITDSCDNVIWVPGLERSKEVASNNKLNNIAIKYII